VLTRAAGRSARRSFSGSPGASTNGASVEQGATADHGSLLPVLAARDTVVDEAVAEMFGELRPDMVRGGGSDVAGWVRGKLAADLAQLNLADLDTADSYVDPAGACTAELPLGV
jgi:hypothetical protein